MKEAMTLLFLFPLQVRTSDNGGENIIQLSERSPGTLLSRPIATYIFTHRLCLTFFLAVKVFVLLLSEF